MRASKASGASGAYHEFLPSRDAIFCVVTAKGETSIGASMPCNL